jgi:hypothetical protein
MGDYIWVNMGTNFKFIIISANFYFQIEKINKKKRIKKCQKMTKKKEQTSNDLNSFWRST